MKKSITVIDIEPRMYFNQCLKVYFKINNNINCGWRITIGVQQRKKLLKKKSDVCVLWSCLLIILKQN